MEIQAGMCEKEEKKLMMKLQEAEEAVSDGNGWLDLDEVIELVTDRADNSDEVDKQNFMNQLLLKLQDAEKSVVEEGTISAEKLETEFGV